MFPFENKNNEKCKKKNISSEIQIWALNKHSVSDLAKQIVDQGPKAASKPKFDGVNGSTSKHEDDLVGDFARNKYLSGLKTTKNLRNQ